MKDLSDRELERFLQENNAGKWFCKFELSYRTPDHTTFFSIFLDSYFTFSTVPCIGLILNEFIDDLIIP